MPLPCIDPADYDAQLAAKVERFKTDFAPFALPEPAVHASAPQNYRMRAEFRIWHDHDCVDRVDYAMFDAAEPKQPIAIESFPTAVESICVLMSRLREAVSLFLAR